MSFNRIEIILSSFFIEWEYPSYLLICSSSVTRRCSFVYGQWSHYSGKLVIREHTTRWRWLAQTLIMNANGGQRLDADDVSGDHGDHYPPVVSTEFTTNWMCQRSCNSGNTSIDWESGFIQRLCCSRWDCRCQNRDLDIFSKKMKLYWSSFK